ncbi:MAG TPA: type II toxin-antitoxin system RelE/ParE family toxin [Longimicrobium sp.]
MYDVVVERSAVADIAHHYRYLSEHAHTAGYPDVWFDAITVAILGLVDFPLRFAIAPENAEFQAAEIRHRIVGSYRLIFTVAEQRVHVLHIRHMRQDVLNAG